MLDCMTLTLSYFHIFLHRHSTLLTLLISGDLTPPVTSDLFPLNCFLKATPDVSYQQILASQIHNIGIPACPALSPMLAVKTLCPNTLNCQIPGIIFSLFACGASPVHTLGARECVSHSAQSIWPRHFLRGNRLVAREE